MTDDDLYSKALKIIESDSMLKALDDYLKVEERRKKKKGDDISRHDLR